VVLLHGFLGTGGDWDEITERLGPGFRCLCPDLPGHGSNLDGPPPSGYTMDYAALQVMERLDKEGIERCALVGYSMGGRLALYLAVNYPERFNALVVESASPGLKDPEQRQHRADYDADLAKELEGCAGDTAAFKGFLGRWYAMPLFETLARDRDRIDRLVGRRLENDPAALAHALRGMSPGLQPSLWEQLPRLPMPVLAMVGDEDGKFRRIGEQMSECGPTIAVHEMQGCGHNVHLEAPMEFATVIKAFIETRG